MAVAIITKALQPTNTKGARIKVARADHRKGDHSVTFDYYSLRSPDGQFDSRNAHRNAFIEWNKGLPEINRMRGGHWAEAFTPTGAVFVLINEGQGEEITFAN